MGGGWNKCTHLQLDEMSLKQRRRRKGRSVKSGRDGLEFIKLIEIQIYTWEDRGYTLTKLPEKRKRSTLLSAWQAVSKFQKEYRIQCSTREEEINEPTTRLIGEKILRK